MSSWSSAGAIDYNENPGSWQKRTQRSGNQGWNRTGALMILEMLFSFELFLAKSAWRNSASGPAPWKGKHYSVPQFESPGDPSVGGKGQVWVANVNHDLYLGSFDALREATTACDVELIVTKANPGPDYQAFLTAECRVLFRPGTLYHTLPPRSKSLHGSQRPRLRRDIYSCISEQT